MHILLLLKCIMSSKNYRRDQSILRLLFRSGNHCTFQKRSLIHLRLRNAEVVRLRIRGKGNKRVKQFTNTCDVCLKEFYKKTDAHWYTPKPPPLAAAPSYVLQAEKPPKICGLAEKLFYDKHTSLACLNFDLCHMLKSNTVNKSNKNK